MPAPLVGRDAAPLAEFTDPDNTTWKHKVYAADTKQLIDAGFHGVKLDDCGDGTGAGLLERVAAINASGRALLIENSAANAAFLSLPLCPPRHTSIGTSIGTPENPP